MSFLTEREKRLIEQSDYIIQLMQEEIDFLKAQREMQKKQDRENVVARNSDTDRPRTDSTS